MKRTFIIAVGLIAVLACVAGFFLFRTFSRTGEKAIAVMTTAEKEHLQSLSRVRRGMSYDQVAQLLGEPSRPAAGLRPTWQFQGSSLSQVAVYFDNEGARKIRWMSLGRFTYESPLKQ